jgi:hypothetical protein
VAGTDVDSVADELYALPSGEFVAARDARVREARADGDKEAAGEIAALRKPTVVAWLANQLARQRPEHVQPLVELGEAMREATAALSGPELRELSRQRNELVHALVQEARGIGSAAGQRVGEETVRGLEATLHAALADPEAAERLVEGRLSDGMTFSGFSATSVPGSAAAPGAPTRRRAKREPERSAQDEKRAARRRELEQKLGDAWAAAGRATEARDSAADAAERAERRKAEASREVDRLRQALAGAEDDLRSAAAEHEEAVAARVKADQAARQARRTVTDLQARLDKL